MTPPGANTGPCHPRDGAVCPANLGFRLQSEGRIGLCSDTAVVVVIEPVKINPKVANMNRLRCKIMAFSAGIGAVERQDGRPIRPNIFEHWFDRIRFTNITFFLFTNIQTMALQGTPILQENSAQNAQEMLSKVRDQLLHL